MPDHDHASRNHSRISIREVSPATWQVRVSGVSGERGSMLLGYIQRVGDVFEATSLARPRDSIATSTMDQAATSITDRTALS